MAEGFLQRYSQELSALRRRAARFAAAHPKIAGRLRLSAETADDPHVERLVQSFAFVTARVRQKLDDEFPELTGGLLETLYPHYLAPIPAMMLLGFTPAAGLQSLQRIARHTEIECEAVENENCRFRTTQELVLAPLTLTAVRLQSQPIEAPLAPRLKAAACLRLSLRPHEGVALDKLGLSTLRFQILAPWRDATALYELVHNHACGIALARHADDPQALFLPASQIKPVGFAPEEGMLPYPATSFAGYRLLSEFFALPQKFLAFEIGGLATWAGETLEIFIYLDQPLPALERQLGAESLAINTVPAINLFCDRTEPISLDGTRTEYTLVPDARQHATREVHSVTQVHLSDGAGYSARAAPFFAGRGESGVTWQLQRHFDPLDGSSEASIALIDRVPVREARGKLTASLETLVLNRDLPARLPYGGGRPQMTLVNRIDAVTTVSALSAPTPVLRFADDEERHWRLASHLNLNHLSLLGGDGAALKEMLRLYVQSDRRDINLLIDAIVGLDSRAAMARVGGGAMVPGSEIDLTFDPGRIEPGSAYLFAMVLDRFFGLYGSINSFTRLRVTMKGQDEPLADFPARYAERPLL